MNEESDEFVGGIVQMTDHSDLIERLNTWLKLDVHNGFSKTNALIEEAATVLKTMGADAERYRWIRDHHTWVEDRDGGHTKLYCLGSFTKQDRDVYYETLDASMDPVLHPAISRTRAEDYVNAAESVRALEPNAEAIVDETNPVEGGALSMAETQRILRSKPPVTVGDLSLDPLSVAAMPDIVRERLASLNKTALSEDQIKHMVDRFLQWRLPEHFRPDAGISFKPPENLDWWPVGTNLFDAQQAEAMVRFMVEGLAGVAQLYAKYAYWRERCVALEAVMAQGTDNAKPPSTPQPNPVAFDEAAERKLFEGMCSGEYDFVKLPTGDYKDMNTHCALYGWLASAKVQRGASPPAIEEVYARLVKLLGNRMLPTGVHHEIYALAAKLGGGK